MHRAGSRRGATAWLRAAVTALTVCLCLTLIAGCQSNEPPPAVATARVIPAGKPVDHALFGTHVAGMASGGQPLPPRAGAIRLWDAGVSWRQLEPAAREGRLGAPGPGGQPRRSPGRSHGHRVGARQPRPSGPPRTRRPGLYGPGTSSAPGPARVPGDPAPGRHALPGPDHARTRCGTRPTSGSSTAARRTYLAAADRSGQDGAARGRPGRHAGRRQHDHAAVRAGQALVRQVHRGAGRALDWPVDAMAVHLYPRRRPGRRALGRPTSG